MNRNDFILELKKHLKGLSEAEIYEAISYYEEYFSEAGSENEDKVIADLGSPKDIAMKILGDCTMKNIESDERPAKKWSKMILLIVLGIFASPVALPLGIALIVVAVALIISVSAVIFSFFSTAVALVICGILTVFMGLSLIINELPTAMFFGGFGLISISTGILIFLGTYMLSKISFKGISILTAKWFIKKGGEVG